MSPNWNEQRYALGSPAKFEDEQTIRDYLQSVLGDLSQDIQRRVRTVTDGQSLLGIWVQKIYASGVREPSAINRFVTERLQEITQIGSSVIAIPLKADGATDSPSWDADFLSLKEAFVLKTRDAMRAHPEGVPKKLLLEYLQDDQKFSALVSKLSPAVRDKLMEELAKEVKIPVRDWIRSCIKKHTNFKALKSVLSDGDREKLMRELVDEIDLLGYRDEHKIDECIALRTNHAHIMSAADQSFLDSKNSDGKSLRKIAAGEDGLGELFWRIPDEKSHLVALFSERFSFDQEDLQALVAAHQKYAETSPHPKYKYSPALTVYLAYVYHELCAQQVAPEIVARYKEMALALDEAQWHGMADKVGLDYNNALVLRKKILSSEDAELIQEIEEEMKILFEYLDGLYFGQFAFNHLKLMDLEVEAIAQAGFDAASDDDFDAAMPQAFGA